jgi:hypothetical protein
MTLDTMWKLKIMKILNNILYPLTQVLKLLSGLTNSPGEFASAPYDHGDVEY